MCIRNTRSSFSISLWTIGDGERQGGIYMLLFGLDV